MSDVNEAIRDDSLRSKRELLEMYGISYGALYRWKRKGLIPDDWFIRKSTSTGQETFFPKKLICERVNYILLAKDEASLDELAGRVNEEKYSVSLVIDTKFGEKTFALEHINKIIIRGGNREINITDILSNYKFN